MLIKHHRLPFPGRIPRPNYPLEVVQSDLSGCISTFNQWLPLLFWTRQWLHKIQTHFFFEFSIRDLQMLPWIQEYGGKTILFSDQGTCQRQQRRVLRRRVPKLFEEWGHSNGNPCKLHSKTKPHLWARKPNHHRERSLHAHWRKYPQEVDSTRPLVKQVLIPQAPQVYFHCLLSQLSSCKPTGKTWSGCCTCESPRIVPTPPPFLPCMPASKIYLNDGSEVTASRELIWYKGQSQKSPVKEQKRRHNNWSWFLGWE